MVRHGVGVAIAVVVLAGCGGGSDEDKVVAAVKQLDSSAQRRDFEKLCGEVLHPNTVRAVERMARADAAPGDVPPSCQRGYPTSGLRRTELDAKAVTAEDVDIAGDVAYLSAADGKRPVARRDGEAWKIDFTADPTTAWVVRASSACVRWQDALQAASLPPANRQGIIAALRREATTTTAFRRALNAEAAPGAAKTPASDLAASLDRMNTTLESTAAALQRGRSLEDATKAASEGARAEAAELYRATGAAGVRCGRIPWRAADGAAFRRRADAMCKPVVRQISRVADPSNSLASVTRFLRRVSALERRASRDLAALTPPVDLARVYRDTLSTLAGLGATLRAEGAAAARHDLAGARRAVARLGPLDYRKTEGFSRLGLAECAEL